MSRRSTRIQAKDVQEEAKPPSLASSSTTSPKPARKKQKVTASTEPTDALAPTETTPAAPKAPAIWAKTRGRRGHLKMVAEMPFDILLEMFQYLAPLDLLNLSKANHAFRGLLLDRSTSLHLWKEAFARVDPKPPTCPEDMSLPQYANLLYGRTCFFCESIHGLTRSWTGYVRFCKSCLSGNNFITLSGASKGSVEYHLNRMVAILYNRETRQSRAVRADYEKHRIRLDQLKDDQESFDQYVSEESAKYTRRQDRSSEYRGWEYSILRMKHQDVKERRGTRKEAILEKLEQLGYKALMTRIGNWQVAKLPGLTGVKPLTDREWERIRPSITAALDVHQNGYNQMARSSMISRRTPLLKTLLEYYFSHHRDMKRHGPEVGQVAKLEPFRTLIYDTPADQELHFSDFVALLDDMTQALETWRQDAEATLLGLVPTSSTPAASGQQRKAKMTAKAKGKAKEWAPDASVLKLATTIFECKWCGNLLPYPHVLDHLCMYRRHRPCQAKGFVPKRGIRNRRNDAAYQYIYYSEEDRSDPNVAWNEGGQQLRFHAEASKYAAAIIKELGEDPETVTWEELDKANQRVECLRCQKPKPSAHRRLAMDWRQAIVHELNSENFKDFKEHASPAKKKLTYETAWRKLDDASLEKALQKENPASTEYTSKRCQVVLACVECGMQTLDEPRKVGGLVTIVDPAATKCAAGHDLSKGTYVWNEFSESFTSEPLPVKIP